MSAELIHQMYIAYYQRPADPAGLIYWQDQLNANGGGSAGWNAVAAAFANAPESSALYGSQTLGQKISAIYLAAFERAASADEVAYWEASGFNAAQIGFAVVNGAQNDDLSTVNKKVAYSTEFVKVLDPAGTGVGPFTKIYDDASVGRQLLDPITKDSTVTASTVSSDVTSNLPTLNPVALTSGPDVVTPTSDVEQITASLGGSTPTLGRDDVIDGGSGNDIINIDADASFLLGFSTGRMSGVETMNIAATTSSVTPKIFNFVGTSGVQTINVGAANAKIELKNVNDAGIAVNLSGQTAGTFKLDFASGTISGSGSALSFGVANVGTATGDVTLQADGIVDLSINSISSGDGKSYVNLNNGANDLKTVTVSGTSDLDITNLGSTVTAVDASGMAGDFLLTVDVDVNADLLASGKTVTGGAGYDTLKILGSGDNIVRASTTSFEHFYFDGSESKPIIKATGVEGLQAMTFSGQASDGAVSLAGLRSGALTVNATLNNGSASTQTISAQGNLTVNLNADPASVASQTQEDNDFSFNSPTQDAVIINVGAYVSAAGTYTVNQAGSVTVNIDSTADYGATNLYADGAASIIVSGGQNLNGIISGSGASTIGISSGSSDSLTVGSTGLETLTLDFSGKVSAGANSNIEGVTTLSINAGATADFAPLNFTSLQTVTLGGASATYNFNTFDSSSQDTTISMVGSSGGFSAFSIEVASGNLIIDAGQSTGSMNIQDISASEVTITMGTAGNFSATALDARGDFTLSGSNAASASIALTDMSAAGDATISFGGSEGNFSAGVLDAASNIIINAGDFGGSATITDIGSNGSDGDVTITGGSKGDLALGTITIGGDLTINNAAHTSGTGIGTLTDVASANNVTIALGAGSGTYTAADINAHSDLVIDGGSFAGNLVVSDASASGNLTISAGVDGLFSGNTILGGGDFVFTNTEQRSTSTAGITLTSVDFTGGVSLSLGAGLGSFSAGTLIAGKDIILDASNFQGTIAANEISASGAVNIAFGGIGDFSAGAIMAAGDITISSTTAQNKTGDIVLTDVSGSGAVTISLGAHSGTFTAGQLKGNDIIFEATNYSGTIKASDISASGSLTITTGTLGDFSAENVNSLGDFIFTAAAHTTGTGDITMGAISASGAGTITLGAGSGTFSAGLISTSDDLIIDASTFGGTIENNITESSGDVTISIGTAGDYNGSAIDAHNDLTFNAAAHTTGTGDVDLTYVSASGNISIVMGSSSGDFTMNGASSELISRTLTIDGTNYKGGVDISSISASNTMTVTTGSVSDFSAEIIQAGNSTFNFSAQAATDSGNITLSALSGSSTTISLGAGTGSFSAASINMSDDIAINAASFGGTIDVGAISGSGVSITGGTRGDFSAEDVYALGTFTLDGSTGVSGSTVKLHDVTAGAVNITLGNATGADVLLSAIDVGGAFTLNATGETQGNILVAESLSASASITIGIGASTNFSGSSIDAGVDFTLNQSGQGSGSITVRDLGVGGAVSITLGAGSSSLTLGSAGQANGLSAGGAITLDASQSSQTDLFDINNISGSSTITVITGLSGDFDGGSSITSTAGDFTLTQSGSGEIKLATINELTSGSFTLNMVGGTAYVQGQTGGSAIGITAGAAINFNLTGDGRKKLDFGGLTGSGITVAMTGIGSFSAGAVVSTGSGDVSISTFGAASADISIGSISAANNVTFTLGENSGDVVFTTSLDVAGDLTIAASGFKGDIDIPSISADDVIITLGESSVAGNAFSASVVDVQSFTMTGPEFRENVSINMLSASAVSITLGEQTDAFNVHSAITAESFSFNGGTGGSFSASVSSLLLNGSGFSILMPEDGNGLNIVGMSASGGGVITGTSQSDTINVTAIGTASVIQTLDIDLRDADGKSDTVQFLQKSAAPILVVLRGFDGSAAASANGDTLHVEGTGTVSGNEYVTAVGAATAAALLSTALGESITASQLTSASGNATVASSASFTYNNDFYYFGYNLDGDTSFEAGDTIFRFVGAAGGMDGGDIDHS